MSKKLKFREMLFFVLGFFMALDGIILMSIIF